ncbi:Mlo-related protein [Corchorus olitorius]|uniref:MLO-like protein n=1 Tax=Corchorus olitorius TaxID=93759 RepID=A0A1R3GKY6_9ROSI|nr:Mlo-related protein [Corchorus olitorius]
MAGGGEEEGTSLEYTPTWILAAVCTVIVAVSLVAERLLHCLGNKLKTKNQKPLYEALQKLKEELMLLGFISLLLTVSQSLISEMCISENALDTMLPCKPQKKEETSEGSNSTSTTSHFQKFFASTLSSRTRRLLAETAESSKVGYCAKRGKVPLLSTEALHHLHIFIFVLAVVHVTFCVLTVSFGGLRIRQWKHWEDEIAKQNYDTEEVLKKKVTHVHQHAFIKEHFLGFGKNSIVLGWLHSFFKQFYASVTKADYVTLRLGFITLVSVGVCGHILVAECSWMAYIFLDSIHSFHKKHVAIEGDLVVQPSDEHFWFNRPRIVLYLIHFILFQNAFEMAFFFWIWVQFGFESCIMGQLDYIIPRLVIGQDPVTIPFMAIIQLLCSYSTLPLYAIVTQMGSSFKKAIFEEHVQGRLIGWAQNAKKRKALKSASEGTSLTGTVHSASEGSSQAASVERPSVAIQMGRVLRNASAPEEIHPAKGSDGSQ